MKNKIILIFIILEWSNISIFGQLKTVNRDNYQFHITRTQESMNINGLLDEKSWENAAKVGSFHRVTPTDTGFAIAQTEVRITYDDKNFYVGAVCYDPTPGKRIIPSLRRDFTSSDCFQVFIDTYNDQTNGFSLGVSAAGVQKDELLYDGNKFNRNWDAKWRSAVRSYEDRWVAELCIPFNSLRYFEGANEWGINFGRFDYKTNEKSAWAPVPRQFPHCDLSYTGKLIWDKPLDKSGWRFSFIPYITGQATRNNETFEVTKWRGDAGFDNKLMLSSSLNLDITVNPNYSQVEEDKQQTNLDRFELFFPERRQFFLENNDLFADLGSNITRPFFSRRVGLNVPVIVGGKLSGRIGDYWRIGFMDVQTKSEGNIPSSNYAVAVLQRQVFSRSNITGFIINKEITSDFADSIYSGREYNRVVGLEYNLASPDNKLTGKGFYHQSYYPGAKRDAATLSGSLTYSTQFFKASLNTTWVGSDYIAEFGYIKRAGYYQFAPDIGYTFYPNSKYVLSHGPSLQFDILYDPEFEMTDRLTQLTYTIGFQSRGQLLFHLSQDFVVLDHEYDPTNTNGIKFDEGESFTWQSIGISFQSDSRRLLNYSLDAGYGSYYNGTRWNTIGSLNYRIQPYGSIALTVDYNMITLPEPYNSAEFLLIGPKLDVTFTDKIFLTTFIQYNNQINNLNTNIRFQWRFAPVSDLFIVYTGNSYTEVSGNKNRGVVVKLSYWFN